MSDQEMSFSDHLNELRRRMLISLGAVVLFSLLIYIFFGYKLLDILQAPVFSRASAPPKIITLDPYEIFFVFLKISLVGGLCFATPVILYEAVAFIAPGLTDEERKMVRPAILGSSVLFLAGVAMCYFFVLPYLYDFFIRMNQDAGTAITWSLARIVDSVLMMLLAFGFSFEMPVLIIILTQLGIVTPSFLAERRKYAFFIILLAAAIITPQDLFSMLALGLPLYLLYELSIVLSVHFHKKKLRHTHS